VSVKTCSGLKERATFTSKGSKVTPFLNKSKLVLYQKKSVASRPLLTTIGNRHSVRMLSLGRCVRCTLFKWNR
jgi:hypothetical protein